MSKPPRILVIAGSDSSGGAGIQADIKTITMLGGYAMTAITAITAQNTMGVSEVRILPPGLVARQIEACDDIGVDAIKIGMLGNEATIRAVEEAIGRRKGLWRAPVVLDPVMIAKGGARLLDEDAVAALWSLMGSAYLVTPNIPELEALMDTGIRDEATAARAGMELADATGSYVLAKGGHLPGDEVVDLVLGGGEHHRFASPRIQTPHTHGTGCTLASAVATYLGTGLSLPDAVARARNFVRAALLAAPGFGSGHGPMGHQAVR